VPREERVLWLVGCVRPPAHPVVYSPAPTIRALTGIVVRGACVSPGREVGALLRVRRASDRGER
jgi:hypothetical protein